MRGYNDERGCARAGRKVRARDKLLIFARLPESRQCHQIKAPSSRSARGNTRDYVLHNHFTSEQNPRNRAADFAERRRSRAREYPRDLPNFTAGFGDSAPHAAAPGFTRFRAFMKKRHSQNGKNCIANNPFVHSLNHFDEIKLSRGDQEKFNLFCSICSTLTVSHAERHNACARDYF